MKTRISVIDSHTAGEPTRMVVGGVPRLSGTTMSERMLDLQANFDWLRRVAMHEPRGHRDMFGCVLMEPSDPSAHIGAVYMDGGRFYNMCGHASLGICGMLVETGQVQTTGTSTEIRIDTPAGLVVGTVETTEAGDIKTVALIDVPSFAYELGAQVLVEGYGKIPVDIGYGGNFFVIASAEDMGFPSIEPRQTTDLIKAGIALRHAANQQFKVRHPERSHINRIDIAMLTAPPSGPHADGRNIVILGDAQADRSPCGTGTCARLAVEFAKGVLSVNETYRHESSIGTIFDARIFETTKVGSFDAIIPEISCRPYLTGFSDLIVDPDDPFGSGFVLG